MGKFISNLFLGALALGLSIFTGSRTLDLLAWALPSGQTIYQWLGLAAFEGGMYFWSFYFISGAKGTAQRSISLCMAVFSVLAVCIATIADMSLDAGQAGKIAAMPASAQQAMIVFVGVTVALNVAGFLACKLMSVEKLREIKEGQAEDMIYSEGLRAIEAITPSIASAAAPLLATEWANRTWNKIVPGMQGRTEYLGQVGAAVPALPAGSPEPLPLQSPRRPPSMPVQPASAQPAQSTPVVYDSEPPKQPGGLRRFMDKLSSSEKQPTVTLAQTGTIPAQPASAQPTPAPQPAPAPVPAQPAPAPAPASTQSAIPRSTARRMRRAARRSLQPGATGASSGKQSG